MIGGDAAWRAWIAEQDRRFRRQDAARYLAPDAARFYRPDRADRRFWADPRGISRANPFAAATGSPRATKSEVDALWAEQRVLRQLAAELEQIRWRMRLARKYSPDQPRVPAGNPDGGQWTAATSAGAAASAAASASDASADGLKPGAQYAQNDRLSGYPVDLREEERLGGHTIGGHVGKTFEYLAERVREWADRTISRGDDFRGFGVGSFSSLDSAMRLVNSTIAQNDDIVSQVTRGEKSTGLMSAYFNSPTGYEAYLDRYNSEPYKRDIYGVGVVIVRDLRVERGWRVLTAYPKR